MRRIQEVDNYIADQEEQHTAILNYLRDLIEKKVPEALEEFKWSRPVYKGSKPLFYLIANKKHVNLGFYSFENLQDPKGLLEGTGKTMRHIKLKSLEEAKEASIEVMLEQAQKS